MIMQLIHRNHLNSDVLLECLGVNWELHRPYIKQSHTLCQLLENADNPIPKKYYKNKMSEKLDHFINSNDTYSNECRVRHFVVIPTQIMNHTLWVAYLLFRNVIILVPMADPGFPVGGTCTHWGGHGPPMRALFGENVCENERIGSHMEWCAPGTPS